MNKIVKDITTVTDGIIAHGCNCQGAFGSGVAGAIRAKWPSVYREYDEYVRHIKPVMRADLLGTVQMVNVYTDCNLNTLFVANCFTQEFFGSDGKVYANIKSIEEALGNVAAFAELHNLPVYLPPIGCGLGGLDFHQDLEPILTKLEEEFPSVVFVLCDVK